MGPDCGYNEAEMPLAASACSGELLRFLDSGKCLLVTEELSLSTVNGGVGQGEAGNPELR